MRMTAAHLPARRAPQLMALIFVTAAFFFGGVLSALPAARTAPQTIPAAAPPAPAALRLQADQALDEASAFLSGLAPASGRYASLQELGAWKSFAEDVGRQWQKYDEGTLKLMSTWAAGLFPEACGRTGAIFYPFGGPDAVNALTLFPTAGKLVLMGLEPVGSLPDFEKEDKHRTEQFFVRMKQLTEDFLKRGYFVTEHMNEAYRDGYLDGTLPVILFFLKRSGFSVASIHRLLPDGGTGWIEMSYEAHAKRPNRPYGVRIDCFRPGDAEGKTIYYFSCDLSDQAAIKNVGLNAFVDQLGDVATFIKSASYLLHYNEFSRIRQTILDRSLYVIEDDTGVPYRYFLDGKWEVELFGCYADPVSDFKGVDQNDLRAAFKAGSPNVHPLPFHFGYHWVSKYDNVLFMKRKTVGQ